MIPTKNNLREKIEELVWQYYHGSIDTVRELTDKLLALFPTETEESVQDTVQVSVQVDTPKQGWEKLDEALLFVNPDDRDVASGVFNQLISQVRQEALDSQLTEVVEIVEEYFKGLIHIPSPELTKKKLIADLKEKLFKKYE